MPLPVPPLQLTQGQMAWALCYGRTPDQRTRNTLRYLRQLGIPLASAAALGSGNRVLYNFFDLVETGLGLTGLGLGFRPKDIADVLVVSRDELRKVYATAWSELSEAAMSASWVKSRGRMTALMEDELYVRLHERWRERAASFDFVDARTVSPNLPLLEPIEQFNDGPPRRVLPLKRLTLQWVAWALEAPDIRPGRR